MDFSFELSGALITGNINQDAMMGMGAVVGALFGGIAIARITVMVVIAVLMIISRWRIFEKAGIPGWGALIPFYNRYLMFKIGGRSGWNFLWILIPPVFAIFMIINYFKIAQRFGKDRTYGLGIMFLKVIFIPILAFDNSEYIGHKVVSKTNTPHTSHTPVHKTIEKKAPVKVITKKVVAKKTPAKKVKTLTKKK